MQLNREQAGLGASNPTALALGAGTAHITSRVLRGTHLGWTGYGALSGHPWEGMGRADFEKPSHSRWGHLAAEVTTSRTWR